MAKKPKKVNCCVCQRKTSTPSEFCVITKDTAMCHNCYGSWHASFGYIDSDGWDAVCSPEELKTIVWAANRARKFHKPKSPKKETAEELRERLDWEKSDSYWDGVG
jgi:hypothetical protein